MTDMVTKIEHYDNARNKVIPNLEKPNFLEFVDIFSEEVQVVEDLLFDILENTTLEKAIGIQLDRLGEKLDTSRNGLGDEPYRTALRNAIFEKAKHGGINDLISVCRIHIPQAITVTIDEYYPNTALIFIEVEDPATITTGDLFVEALTNAKQAAIEIDPIAIEMGTYFLFSTLSVTTPASRGFSTLSDPTGGILGGLVK